MFCVSKVVEIFKNDILLQREKIKNFDTKAL